MPDEEKKSTPQDEAIAAGKCPECNVELEGLDARSHRDQHWPKQPPDDSLSAEARRRWQLITDYAKEHPATQPE